jgi:hypothetical protein
VFVGEKKKMSQDLFKKILRKYKGKLHSQDTMELSDVGIFMLIMFDFFISSLSGKAIYVDKLLQYTVENNWWSFEIDGRIKP